MGSSANGAGEAEEVIRGGGCVYLPEAAVCELLSYVQLVARSCECLIRDTNQQLRPFPPTPDGRALPARLSPPPTQNPGDPPCPPTAPHNR